MAPFGIWPPLAGGGEGPEPGAGGAVALVGGSDLFLLLGALEGAVGNAFGAGLGEDVLGEAGAGEEGGAEEGAGFVGGATVFGLGLGGEEIDGA
jgi:hypothetical protein